LLRIRSPLQHENSNDIAHLGLRRSRTGCPEGEGRIIGQSHEYLAATLPAVLVLRDVVSNGDICRVGREGAPDDLGATKAALAIRKASGTKLSNPSNIREAGVAPRRGALGWLLL
jgi:hypothetical protein